jgi:putative transposase
MAELLDCGSPLPLSTLEKSLAPPEHRVLYSIAMSEHYTPWPHAPTHQLSTRGTYFLTASTYGKLHHFRGADRLCVLHRGLLKLTRDFGWQLEAWAVFSNHYHFVGHSPATESDATSLSPMVRMLHVKTAEWVNRLDAAPGRQVWFNFRETRLTYQQSYLARLNYVHQNPVKHRLVLVANQYPWCSAAWLERTASPAMVKSIYRFRVDRLNVVDDFDPAPDF